MKAAYLFIALLCEQHVAVAAVKMEVSTRNSRPLWMESSDRIYDTSMGFLQAPEFISLVEKQGGTKQQIEDVRLFLERHFGHDLLEELSMLEVKPEYFKDVELLMDASQDKRIQNLGRDALELGTKHKPEALRDALEEKYGESILDLWKNVVPGDLLDSMSYFDRNQIDMVLGAPLAQLSYTKKVDVSTSSKGLQLFAAKTGLDSTFTDALQSAQPSPVVIQTIVFTIITTFLKMTTARGWAITKCSKLQALVSAFTMILFVTAGMNCGIAAGKIPFENPWPGAGGEEKKICAIEVAGAAMLTGFYLCGCAKCKSGCASTCTR